MAKITIIGGGQSGLQLGVGLLQNGYDVTIVSDRTPEQIREGRVTSSQCMFSNALDHERALGMNFWDDSCPWIDGISLQIPHPEVAGAKAIDWSARLDRPAQSVDQRIKFPRWMEHFEASGGRLVFHAATVEDMEKYADESDLVVVAAGKGEIARFFERDDERSQFDRPMRELALSYVNGLAPRPEHTAVCFNIIPGVGEYFVFPAETTTGPCEIMVFEGVPGGPMDCWADVTTPEEHLAKSRWILDTLLPWEGARCDDVELTDAMGTLVGRIAPTVRKPVGVLPSGRPVFGMADAVLLNDPITGQGSNNASKGANIYLRSIVERGEGPFDAAWMQGTFEELWAYADKVITWTNGFLTPPPPHVLNMLGAAGQFPAIAHRFVNGFDDPRDFHEWLMDPAKADAYLAEVAAGA